MVDTTGKVETYPTYATQIINLANRNAQATRPSKVGQMSELIQKFDGRTYRQWETWYTNRYPNAIDRASGQTWAMLEKMKKTMNSINKPMVRRWVSELILAKTYIGLKFQKSILKKIASMKNTTSRLSNPEEEARGIDGYIGATAVSIKPVTYKSQPLMQDTIRAPIIYYEKVRGGINVYYDSLQ
ncbi:MAG: MjaI family restriction endonuclease [Deltaproteobacteria bacterium]|nr:MjaI family restriction endonuclease [Deltaproteobacteria bacterium]